MDQETDQQLSISQIREAESQLARTIWEVQQLVESQRLLVERLEQFLVRLLEQKELR